MIRLIPKHIRLFIADSTSGQISKGTHRALQRLKYFINIVSANNTRTAWALTCDIRKFFANIDHGVLLKILAEYVPDKDIIWLLTAIVQSFHSYAPSIGLPIGNLTSQLLVNIYMHGNTWKLTQQTHGHVLQ